MKPRHQRLAVALLGLTGLAIGVALILQATEESVLFFYSPTQVAAGEPPEDRRFRVGGLVVNGSVDREPGSLEVQFTLTDNAETVNVSYAGILPDLFREGQGIIAHGEMDGSGRFVADEVLAKHDENYMPPEVADSLKAMHEGKGINTGSDQGGYSQ